MTKILIKIGGVQGALMRCDWFFEVSVLNPSILSLIISFRESLQFSDILGTVRDIVENHGERQCLLKRVFKEAGKLASLVYVFCRSRAQEKRNGEKHKEMKWLGCTSQSRQERQEWDTAVWCLNLRHYPSGLTDSYPSSTPIHIYNGNVIPTVIKTRLIWAS